MIKTISRQMRPAQTTIKMLLAATRPKPITRYKRMERCTTRMPKVNYASDVAGGILEKFPKRLNVVPPRVLNGSLSGVTAESYNSDTQFWKKHVEAYKRINKYIGEIRYRNVMDMNAGLGGFAAALTSNKAWVMNVVPTIAKDNTLGVIYERGLIGIYHDWENKGHT